MSCAKMDEPIEMLFGMWTRVSAKNHTAGPRSPKAKGQFWGVTPCRAVFLSEFSVHLLKEDTTLSELMVVDCVVCGLHVRCWCTAGSAAGAGV